MAGGGDSIQLPMDLVAELLGSSLKLQEVGETREVQLDKKTVKRLKTGCKEFKKRQYKTASSREDIDRILSNRDARSEDGLELAEKLPRAHYDQESDSLYIVISKGPEEGFIELAPDINLDLGKNGKVIGTEILKASKVLRKVAPLARTN